MQYSNIIEKFRSHPKRKILVVGDIILDTFINGNVDRISPEKPVPVLNSTSRRDVVGGAGNVAFNIAKMGFECILVGALGADDEGKIVQNLCMQQNNLNFHSVEIPTVSTTHKLRYTSNGQHLLRVDRDQLISDRFNFFENFKNIINTIIQDCEVLVISDYAKGVIDSDTTDYLSKLCSENKIRIISDPKSHSLELYRGSDIVTPNLKELQNILGRKIERIENFQNEVLSVIDEFDLGGVLVTLSEDGMIYFGRDREVFKIPSLAKEVYDVVGAGDTVVAFLAICMSLDIDLRDCAVLSNLAASIVVGKQGTATVDPDEFFLALMEHDHNRNQATEFDSLDLASIRNYCTSRGLKLGFTNGVFDVLHNGHLQLLKYCKTKCDFLIVGINSDSSARRLNKGADRPWNCEAERRELLSSMNCVDLVISFDTDTPFDLIQTLKPDILIKGGDYKLDQIVGHDIVMAYGGEVLIYATVPGRSSTNLINKMKGVSG